MQLKARKKRYLLNHLIYTSLLMLLFFMNIPLPSLATDAHRRTRKKIPDMIKMKIQLAFSLHRHRELTFSFPTSVSFRVCLWLIIFYFLARMPSIPEFLNPPIPLL